MAEERIIEIEIDMKTGHVSSDTLNFTGKECEEIHDAIQRELQGEILQQIDKPEKEQMVVQIQNTKQQTRY